MGREYTAKSFKSGNSIAIRLPAALGIEPNGEWVVTEENGELHLRPKAVKKYIDVSGFAGKAPGIRLLPREDFEERPSTIAALEAVKASN
ncbi:AbrB/MazE/SpoVT family DNA-binding domain-containing protein [Qipengyuania sediminis]|uniref:AbrB/MazE/SpoVT family DNA-binding domain-containing protein n=1 Tax=Qipengyuania sediminis TaxID=1532023 RepID=UPI00105A9C98|nr:AbrB/MazE/SpoVT family DNA-binding domain-containing protein [Qipengyuania sediminis]